MTREEIIIEMQPFSRGLKEWCKTHPEFTEALKIVYPERFITLQAVSTSYSPNYPDDEVIGFYAYDAKLKTPIFKQDFIVNKGKRNNEFVLYTNYKNSINTRCIKHINDFFATYGKGGYYVNTHHVTANRLPDSVKPRAEQAVQLAERLKITGLRQLTDANLEAMSCRIQELREKGVLN
jgi:hypothetical protein